MGQEDHLEKGMETHSNILAWEYHRQRSLAGCSPCGRKRIGHNLVTKVQQTLDKAFFSRNQLLKKFLRMVSYTIFNVSI